MSQNYLQQLNNIQQQAVTHINGPVLVVAGPGSGKTRVLTYRIAHLIQTGVPPWEILTLTFTNKAAREMKERIEKVVGPRANKVWAGTFHSIFARILRVEADKIGYPSNFTIYDSDDSKSLITNIIKEMNLDTQTYSPNAIRARISSAKSSLITPKLYKDNTDLMQQDRLAKRPFTHAIYARYTARCKQAGAMDFDDLLYRLFELFQKNPDNVLDKYRDRFKYLLVDEFQDTNHLQYAIIRKLVQYEGSPRNICVVGDDAQSIYAFRGATIQNILDFENDYQKHGIKVFKLEQNYRSTEHIVKTANEVIAFNSRQIPKEIWSDKGDGHKIKVLKTLSDTEEGKRVCDIILEQKNRYHLYNKEIAILYRTNAQSRIFEEYLRRLNIPYKVFGGLSFYQRKEVKDLIAYLRLIVNHKDEEAFRRTINFPKRGIGASTVNKIRAAAEQLNESLWDAMLKVNVSNKARNALVAFKKMVADHAEMSKTKNAYEVAKSIAIGSKLMDSLRSDNSIEGMGRLDNFNALLDGISTFVEEGSNIGPALEEQDRSLAAYLQNIALLTDQDTGEKNSDDYVTLMSVHSAKGLEFKSVFIVGLEEKLFPSFMSMDTVEALDEERRLFYVAITRAEQFLTLSYSTQRYRYGKVQYNDPSRFLEEVPKSHIEDTGYIRSRVPQSSSDSGPQMASIKGNFKSRQTAPSFRVDPAQFKPSPSNQIEEAMKVLHLKFGEGRVMKIDGGKDNRIATIYFKDLDAPEKRIMLKFAKLQILD